MIFKYDLYAPNQLRAARMIHHGLYESTFLTWNTPEHISNMEQQQQNKALSIKIYIFFSSHGNVKKLQDDLAGNRKQGFKRQANKTLLTNGITISSLLKPFAS